MHRNPMDEEILRGSVGLVGVDNRSTVRKICSAYIVGRLRGWVRPAR